MRGSTERPPRAETGRRGALTRGRPCCRRTRNAAHSGSRQSGHRGRQRRRARSWYCLAPFLAGVLGVLPRARVPGPLIVARSDWEGHLVGEDVLVVKGGIDQIHRLISQRFGNRQDSRLGTVEGTGDPGGHGPPSLQGKRLPGLVIRFGSDWKSRLVVKDVLVCKGGIDLIHGPVGY